MAIPTQAAFTISFLISVIPIFIILFYTVKNYENYFEDRHFFFALLTALILSILAGLIHILTLVNIPFFFDVVGLIVIVVGLATFETLVKLVFVNLPRFKRKYDTTFYGAAFGFGFASFIVIAITYLNISTDFGVSAVKILSLILFSLSMVFIQGALGIYLGYGVHKQELFRYSFYSVLIQSPFNFIIVMWYVLIWVFPAESGWELTMIALFYAFGIYYYMYNTILPQALPENLRKHRRRAIRKGKRK
jgi:hypothetical protein